LIRLYQVHQGKVYVWAKQQLKNSLAYGFDFGYSLTLAPLVGLCKPVKTPDFGGRLVPNGGRLVLKKEWPLRKGMTGSFTKPKQI
jgi:hypothetical protein